MRTDSSIPVTHALGSMPIESKPHCTGEPNGLIMGYKVTGTWLIKCRGSMLTSKHQPETG